LIETKISSFFESSPPPLLEWKYQVPGRSTTLVESSGYPLNGVGCLFAVELMRIPVKNAVLGAVVEYFGKATVCVDTR
jgi:hypothetical protein